MLEFLTAATAMSPVICPICGKEPSGRSINDSKRLLELLGMNQRVNWKLCEKDQELSDKGFIAFVEAKVPKDPNSLIPPGDAVRTGKVMHIKRELAEKLFDTKIDPKFPMVFADPEVLEKIEKMEQK